LSLDNKCNFSLVLGFPRPFCFLICIKHKLEKKRKLNLQARLEIGLQMNIKLYPNMEMYKTSFIRDVLMNLIVSFFYHNEL